MKRRGGVWLQVVVIAAASACAAHNLDPKLLLDRYAACNRKLETVSFELETVLDRPGEEIGKCVYEIKYCSRHQEKQWIGQCTEYNRDGSINRGKSRHLIDIYTDTLGVHFTYLEADLKRRSAPARLVRDSRNTWLQDYIETPAYGGSLTGHFMGNNGQSVVDLLQGASALAYENQPVKTLGQDAYRIEAGTAYGIVRAWISPQAGYNCLRWAIVKRPGQYYRDGQFTGTWSSTTTYEAEETDLVEEQCVVTRARVNYRVEEGGKVIVDDTYHLRVKNIDLSPDYKSLGAFRIELPEGTLVKEVDHPTILYKWIAGQLVRQSAQPARGAAPIKPEVVLPAKPQGWRLPEDLSPVSKDHVIGHVETLGAFESRHISQPGNKKAEEYIFRELQTYGYAPKTDAFQARGMTLHNVIADASDNQKPVILLSAHFDSCVEGGDSQQSRAPGADDNASGVAVLLELARILKERPVPGNVEFAFFNGEETGRNGSEHLSNRYRDNRWPVDYVVNVDTVGT